MSSTADEFQLPRPALLPRASTLANIFAKTVSVPVEKICRLLLIFVAAPILGEVGFGRYQYADAVTSFLVLGTDLGLGIWTTRALARDAQGAGSGVHAIVGTALWVKLLAALPYLVLVGAAALVTRDQDTRRALVLLGIATLAGSFVEYFNAVFRGFERLRDEARLNIVRALLITGMALIGVCCLRSVLGLAAGLMVGTVGAAAFGVSLLRGRYGLGAASLARPAGVRDRALLARSAVKEAFPLWVATLLSLVYFKGDTVLLRFMAGDAAVGSYSAAYKIFEATMVLPAIIMAATFPAFVRLRGARSPEPTAPAPGGGARAYRSAELRLASGLFLLGATVGGTMFALSAFVIATLFGPAFVNAVASLRVLCLAIPLLFLNFGLTHLLIARSLERRNMAFALAMVACNVPLNLLLIPRLGGRGAAWATFATEVALTLCCLVTLRWWGPLVVPRRSPPPATPPATT